MRDFMTYLRKKRIAFMTNANGRGEVIVREDLYLDSIPIRDLPDKLLIQGNLSLCETGLMTLPTKLRVTGFLDISRTEISKLPEKLSVGDNFYCCENLVTELPSDLRVKEDLYLRSTLVTHLRKSINVGGDIHADACVHPKTRKMWTSSIKTIDAGFVANGSLYLSGSPIMDLPYNLQVAIDLDLRETQITKIPRCLKVGGDLLIPHNMRQVKSY